MVAVVHRAFDRVVEGAVELSALVPVGVTLVHNPEWAQGQAGDYGASGRVNLEDDLGLGARQPGSTTTVPVASRITAGPSICAWAGSVARS